MAFEYEDCSVCEYKVEDQVLSVANCIDDAIAPVSLTPFTLTSLRPLVFDDATASALAKARSASPLTIAHLKAIAPTIFTFRPLVCEEDQDLSVDNGIDNATDCTSDNDNEDEDQDFSVANCIDDEDLSVVNCIDTQGRGASHDHYYPWRRPQVDTKVQSPVKKQRL
jgi:hypothetical protein